MECYLHLFDVRAYRVNPKPSQTTSVLAAQEELRRKQTYILLHHRLKLSKSDSRRSRANTLVKA